MAKVDDLLEKRVKQVVLAIVARLAHRFPPTANLAVEGITNRPNRESKTARKPACTPGFLAKSITCSGQIIAIDQSLPNSSRTTHYCGDLFRSYLGEDDVASALAGAGCDAISPGSVPVRKPYS